MQHSSLSYLKCSIAAMYLDFQGGKVYKTENYKKIVSKIQ